MSDCGVYSIRCCVSGKLYVGSSLRMRARWSAHRNLLRKGAHPSPRLQLAWVKHGEAAFVFAVLEVCGAEERHTREQHHIDALRPDYNSMPVVNRITAEMRAKLSAAGRARAPTQCPQGHAYDAPNTYIDRSGGRRCKQCNADRLREIFLHDTPEQRAARLRRMSEYHAATIETRKAQTLAYRLAHKEQKSAYDRAYKAAKKAARAGLTA